ncbi:hypothetical protein NDU88_006626 [Pleurodeles waltl]|uniref:Uncharacterized protein n=1 Tax=Pleurodeles waltl TaxID=8319 RepID=A0AAV7QMH5_PLEWA|nr:hypothetical protein NDU88_006626 [Pleurodeles waltl]
MRRGVPLSAASVRAAPSALGLLPPLARGAPVTARTVCCLPGPAGLSSSSRSTKSGGGAGSSPLKAQEEPKQQHTQAMH